MWVNAYIEGQKGELENFRTLPQENQKSAAAFSYSILKRSYLGDKPFLSGNQGQAFQYFSLVSKEAGGLRYPWIDVASGDHCAERLRALPKSFFFGSFESC